MTRLSLSRNNYIDTLYILWYRQVWEALQSLEVDKSCELDEVKVCVLFPINFINFNVYIIRREDNVTCDREFNLPKNFDWYMGIDMLAGWLTSKILKSYHQLKGMAESPSEHNF